ncbi:MAG TPA: proline dehydrogenase family protein [Gemmatimonadales bacterium]|nr:proline dehydrogenase family protein [Gemmatimonadales bacterium]
MLRAGLLWLSDQPAVFRFVRQNGLAQKFASRFVAGETIDTALAALRDLNTADVTGTIDLLGESVSGVEEARAARDTYLTLLDRIHAAGARANVSVKLTQMGLDIDEGVCIENLRAILARAKLYDLFVRIDMEGSAYTEKTLALFKERFFPEFGHAVGVVLQSYLRRTEQDVEEMITLRARVRLCKGAYQEPATIAFPDKRDVDANYVRCMERLMERGNYPGIATHDEAILTHARDFGTRRRLDPSRYEFQMLYGVRRDLQRQLRAAGFNLRVYVPFGTHWYPYLMRRLAERPANITFILGNLVKESLRKPPANNRTR